MVVRLDRVPREADAAARRVPKSEFGKGKREYGFKAREADVDSMFVSWDVRSNGSIEVRELRVRDKQAKEDASNRQSVMERFARKVVHLQTVAKAGFELHRRLHEYAAIEAKLNDMKLNPDLAVSAAARRA